MATVYQRGKKGAKTGSWIAKYKVWDAARGKHRWMSQSTGLADETKAKAKAAEWEAVSIAAEAGTMTRDKALESLNAILRVSGCPTVEASPTLSTLFGAIVERRASRIAVASGARYRSHLKRFLGEVGADAKIDTITTETLQLYYEGLTARFAVNTANGHLRTLIALFARAVELGHISRNPAKAVELRRPQPPEKEIITRHQVAKLLRTMRAEGRRDWCGLILLGWHTGHRIQDLMRVTPFSFEQTPGIGWVLTIRPAKKRNAGGRVVRLPIPAHVAAIGREGFDSINGASNLYGVVSREFIQWLKKAGIDPMPVHRGRRVVHLRSFHSFRHSMSSRLAAANTSPDLARMVTDHDSAQVARNYQHAEVAALVAPLRAARRL